MKRIYLLAAMLIALAACEAVQVEPVQEPAPDASGMHAINVSAGFAGGSKTTIVPTEDGYTFLWTAGDNIRIWQMTESGSMASADTQIAEDAATANFSVNFPALSPQPLKYFAVYPYYLDISEVYKDFNGKNRFRIQMATNQTLTEGSFDPNTDLLVSKVVSLDAQPDELDLQFARVGAILKMNLIGLYPDKQIDYLRLTTDVPIAGFVDFDPETGSYHLDASKTEDRDRYGNPIPCPYIWLGSGGDPVYPDELGCKTVFFRTFPAEVSEFTVDVTQGGRSPVSKMRRVNVAAHDGVGPVQLVDGKMTEVTVDFRRIFPVESVTINDKESLIANPMTVGRKYQLTSSLTPLEACVGVDWQSSDQSVATIDQFGLVTPRCNGIVTLYCMAGDQMDSVTVSVVADAPETVDLGLPSGTLWSTCNLGASSPTGYGLYFSWGDPVATNRCIKSGYRFWRYSDYREDYLAERMTKYTFDGAFASPGLPDCKRYLDPADDPATVYLGSEWRSPTKAEFKELIDNCTATREVVGDVNCVRLTSRSNGRSIVIPMSGWAYMNSINNRGELAHFWTCETTQKWHWPSTELSELNAATTDYSTDPIKWSNGSYGGFVSTRNIWASSCSVDGRNDNIVFSQFYRERYYHNYCIRPVKMPAPQAETPEVHIVSVDYLAPGTVRVTLELAEEEYDYPPSQGVTTHTYYVGVCRAGGSFQSTELTDLAKNGRTIVGTLSGLMSGAQYSIYVRYEHKLAQSGEHPTNLISDHFSDNRVRFTASAVDPATMISGFSATPGEVVLDRGQTAQITCTVTPSTAEATVSYYSYDTNVAIVDADGLITATGLGKTSIVCTASGTGGPLYREVTVIVPDRLDYNTGGSAGDAIDDSFVNNGGSY